MTRVSHSLPVLLSVVLTLAACGGSKTGEDTGGGTSDTGTDGADGADGADGTDGTDGTDGGGDTLTGADLVGTWASAGCEAYDDGSGGQNFLTRTFTLTETEWQLDLTIYGDPDCTYGLFTADIVGPYTLGGAAAVEGATNGNFGFTTNVWTPLVEDIAIAFEGSGCGSGDWEVGVGQDVTATGCFGVAKPIAECPVEYDIVKIDGDDLFFGERITNMCEEAGRPAALNAYPVIRQ